MCGDYLAKLELNKASPVVDIARAVLILTVMKVLSYILQWAEVGTQMQIHREAKIKTSKLFIRPIKIYR